MRKRSEKTVEVLSFEEMLQRHGKAAQKARKGLEKTREDASMPAGDSMLHRLFQVCTTALLSLEVHCETESARHAEWETKNVKRESNTKATKSEDVLTAADRAGDSIPFAGTSGSRRSVPLPKEKTRAKVSRDEGVRKKGVRTKLFGRRK